MDRPQSVDPQPANRCRASHYAPEWPYVQRCTRKSDHTGNCLGTKGGTWCRHCDLVAESNAEVALACWGSTCIPGNCCRDAQYTKCADHGGNQPEKPAANTVDVPVSGEYL